MFEMWKRDERVTILGKKERTSQGELSLACDASCSIELPKLYTMTKWRRDISKQFSLAPYSKGSRKICTWRNKKEKQQHMDEGQYNLNKTSQEVVAGCTFNYILKKGGGGLYTWDIIADDGHNLKQLFSSSFTMSGYKYELDHWFLIKEALLNDPWCNQIWSQ